MKKILLLVSILIALNLAVIIKLNKDNNKLKDMVSYAFETGCYAEAMKTCEINKDEKIKENCYEDALKECPNMAEGFKNWVAGGGPK